ncbi:MAG: swmB [Magnetococcales bacterium]|nr:swmB [Magnetococcales bacterium]
MAKDWMERVLEKVSRLNAGLPVRVVERTDAFSQFLSLEPRMMFDGVGLLAQPDDVSYAGEHDVAHPARDDISKGLAQAVVNQRLPETSPRREIMFIDPRVPDYETLLKGASPNLQIVVLDARQDGVQRISEILAGLGTQFDAIHIISHGSDAQVQLGHAILSDQTMENHQEALQGWGKALSADGDILFYGCDVGAGEKGAAFVDRVAAITGADVAASENITGAVNKGGDWILERTVGTLESGVVVDAAAQKDYQGALATISVTSLTDTATENGDGDGKVSLREAIKAARTDASIDGSTAGSGADTIVFDVNAIGAGRTVTLTSALNSIVDTNDLTINGDLGDGGSVADMTIDGGGNNYRFLTVSLPSAAKTVTLQGLNINNFDPLAGTGGAIWIGVGAGVGGKLVLDDCTITNSSALSGGAIANSTASVTLNRTTIDHNSATTGSGGGILSSGGGAVLYVYDSAITNNSAVTVGGGVLVSSGDSRAWVDNSTIYNNSSGTSGGGIRVGGSGYVTITNSTIAGNTAVDDGGGISSGGVATRLNIANCILADNSVTSGTGVDVSGVFTANYSLIEDTIWANVTSTTSNITGDPGLGSLQNYGGTTSTMALDALSSAKDKWTAAELAVFDVRQSALDQRGTGFVRNSNGLIDIGAFEDQLSTVTAGATLAYTEGGVATVIDGTVTVSDVDDTQITGATVTITSGLTAGDVLAFSDQNGISLVSYVPATGVLTLAGTATLANYQTALRSVTFASSSNAPTATSASRTVTWKVADGDQSGSGATSTITITAVNDAPSGTNKTVTIAEDASHTFAAADFGFSDASDDPTNSFNRVLITTLPGQGTLTNNGAAVGVGQYVTVADIAANKLVFTPPVNANGAGYASFTFQVEDDGGTANGGVDLDSTPRTMTIDVTSVNDAPSLNVNPALAAVNEDTTAPVGETIANLFLGQVTDPDAGASLGGVAVVGNTANAVTQGVWQYSSNGGTTWADVGNVGDNATALAVSASSLVRFVPVANYNGVPSALTVRGLDDTYAGGFSSTPLATRVTVDTTINGGATAVAAATNSITTSITAVNDAPVLTGNATLASINEGVAAPGGETIATLFNSAFTNLFSDMDAGSSLGGVAIVGNTANSVTEGVWQYASNGTNWVSIGNVADDSTALALSAATSVRFVPVALYNGTPPPLTVRGLDNTYAGGYSTTHAGESRANVDTSTNGGTTAIASGTDTLGTFINPVNNAPTLLGSATLTAFDEDTAATTATMTSLFGSKFSDVDSGAFLGGVAIVGNTANAVTQGSWQYSPDGGANWYDVGNVGDNANALVISAASLVRFSSVTNYNGPPPALSVRGMDDSYTGAYSTGTRVTLNTSSPGGATAFATGIDTIGVTVNAVNDAPSLTGNAVLASILEDTVAPPGATVAVLFAGMFSDPDAGSTLSGVAIMFNAANAATQGVWQYSSDGSNWFAVGAVAEGATALAIGAGSSLRFVPVANYAGTPSSLFVRALDNAYSGSFSTTQAGQNRVTVDTTNRGGSYPVSSGFRAISTTVTAVSDAPSLTADATLASVGGESRPGGATVNALFGGLFVDVDSGSSLGGLAIIGNTANSVTEGTWQYSSDGINWYSVGAVTDASALFISQSSSVRFTPVTTFTGIPTALTVRAVDNSHVGGYSTTNSGQTRILLDASVNGGTTAISSGMNTLGASISAGNNAPSFINVTWLTSISEDTVAPAGNSVANMAGSLFSDVDAGASLSGIAIVTNIANAGTQGSWQYLTAGGTWCDVGGAVSSANSLVLSSATMLRFVPVVNYEGSPSPMQIRPLDNTYAGGFSSTNGAESRVTIDTTTRGGSTAIGPGLTYISTWVAAVNDAPTLSGDATLAAVSEDTAAPVGNTVTALFGGLFSDIDAGSSFGGIAIVGNTANATTEGVWQYASDGINWANIGVVTDGATALAISAASRVRFVPAADFNGSPPSLTVRALDQTFAAYSTTSVGEVRGLVNTTTPGGTTSISAVTRTLATSITAVNDAPVLTGHATLASVAEDTALPSGETITNLFSGLFTDVDAGSSFGGVAIVGNTANAGTEGVWQYSSDATNWYAVGNVGDDATALALSVASKVRFIPVADYYGTPPLLTVRGLDNAYAAGFSTTNAGQARVTVDTSANGGTTAIAAVTKTMGTSISAVNDAPTIDADNAALSFTEGGGAVVLASGLTLADVDDVDLTGAVVQITGNYVAEDILAFVNQNNITGVWNAGTLTLSGTDSKANYEAALRSITYQNTNTSDPSVLSRTVTFTVTDANTAGLGGAVLTASDTRTITITPVNDAPTVTATVASRSYTEGDGAIAVDSGLTLADVDDGNLTGAVVAITGNYVASEDILAFTDQNGITGFWNAGILTLTGTASKADYQTALQSVTYRNTNTDDPSVNNRTVTFTVADGRSNGQVAAALTGSATRTVTVTAVNDAPTVTATIANCAYTEGDGAIVVDAGLTLADVDDTNLTGAVVAITGNYVAGEDVLAFVDQNGITGSWNAGTLTLTGTASKVDYLTALQSITYQNTNTDDPNPANRTVTFTVTDGQSDGEVAAALTGSATRTIIITPVNDAPTAIATVAPRSYTEGDGAITVDAGLILADVDDANIAGAVVVISGNYVAGEDVLAFTDQNGITGSWNAGTLTLTGTASKADYQTALQSITYRNTNTNDPNPANRTVTFTVTDGQSDGEVAAALTGSATRTITITPVNDAPTMTATVAARSYTEGDGAVVLDAGLTLADVDDTTITGAVVVISGNYVAGEDVLAFTDQNGITGSWNAGTLTLSGTAAKADYQTALQSITYQNTNTFDPNVSNRTVTFTLTDGNSDGEGAAVLTASVTRTVIVTAVNDAPTVVVTLAPRYYTEGAGAILVDAGLTLGDVDDGNLTGAAVVISGNYVAGEDVLAFTDQNGITGSWNAGILTLTGVASKADYQTALQSITYRNTNVMDPSVLIRTVTFTVTDGNSDGEGAGTLTATATRTMTMTGINAAPVVTATVAARPYTEGAGATLVDAGLTLSDVDDVNITGAVVAITGNYVAGEDVLSFVDQNGIAGTWNAGVLTLSGTASKAAYQAALQSITYQNINTNDPNVNNRTVTFTVTDGNSDGEGVGTLTASATRTVTVTGVNDALTVTTTLAHRAYTEGVGAVTVDAGLTLNDVDDENVTGAVVVISGNYVAGEDVLAFTDQNGITGTWNAGTLTLSGTASKADYQTALQSVTYKNTNVNDPNVLNRTVTFTVTDGNSDGEGAGTLTATATRTIVITGVNDAPTVIGTLLPLAYTEGDGAVVLDAGWVLNDVDDTNMTGARVVISGNYVAGEDVLAFTNQNGITGSWNAGTLTLSGTAAKSAYQLALQSITYQNTNGNDPNLANRTVTLTLTDGNSDREGAGVLTATVSRILTFTGVNDAPTLTSATQVAVVENTSGIVSVATGIDPENDTLSWSLSGADAGLFAINAGTGAISFRGAPNFEILGDVGGNNVYDVIVIVTATDNGAGHLTASQAIAFTVTNINETPVGIDDSGSATEVGILPGSNAMGNVLANDTDVDAGTVKTITGVRRGAVEGTGTAGGVGGTMAGSYGALTLHGDGSYTYVVDDANAMVQGLRAGQSLTEAFNYTLSDGALTDTAVLTITINGAHDDPVGAIPLARQVATQDAYFSWQIPADAFIDVDAGTTLTYTATQADGSPLPGWLSFDAATRTWSGTPRNADVGALELRVTVADERGATAQETLQLQVANVNDAPVAYGVIPDFAAREAQPFTLELPKGLFSDRDAGDTLTLSAGFADGFPLPGWLRFDARNMTFSSIPTVSGTHSIRVTATDIAGVRAVVDFKIHVEALPPSLPSVPPPVIGDDGRAGNREVRSDSVANNSGMGSGTLANFDSASPAESVTNSLLSFGSEVVAAPVAVAPVPVAVAPTPEVAATVSVTTASESTISKDAGAKTEGGSGGVRSQGSESGVGSGGERHFADSGPDSNRANSGTMGNANFAMSQGNAPVVVKGFSGGVDEKVSPVAVQGFSDSGATEQRGAVEGLAGNTEAVAPVVVEGFGDAGAQKEGAAAVQGFGDSGTPPEVMTSGSSSQPEEEELSAGEKSMEGDSSGGTVTRNNVDGEVDADQSDEGVAKRLGGKRSSLSDEPARDAFGKRSLTAQLRQFGRLGFHEASLLMLKNMIENQPRS